MRTRTVRGGHHPQQGMRPGQPHCLQGEGQGPQASSPCFPTFPLVSSCRCLPRATYIQEPEAKGIVEAAREGQPLKAQSGMGKGGGKAANRRQDWRHLKPHKLTGQCVRCIQN